MNADERSSVFITSICEKFHQWVKILRCAFSKSNFLKSCFFKSYLQEKQLTKSWIYFLWQADAKTSADETDGLASQNENLKKEIEELKNSNQRLSENDGKLNDEIKNLKKEIEELKTAEETVIVQQVRYISEFFQVSVLFLKK